VLDSDRKKKVLGLKYNITSAKTGAEWAAKKRPSNGVYWHGRGFPRKHLSGKTATIDIYK